MIRIQPGPLRFNVGPEGIHPWLTVRMVPISVLISTEGAGQEIIRDEVYTYQGLSTYRRDSMISVEGGFPTFTSTDPEKATVDANGYVTTLQPGTVGILVVVGRRELVITHTGDFITSISRVRKGYAEGTLGRNITDTIDSLADSDRTELNIYDPDCWANLDWSGVATTNSKNGMRRGVTAISPRHVLMATHYRVPVGYTVTFGSQTRTIVDQTSIPSTDITIGLLDSSVDTFYKVLPTNWEDYMTFHRKLPMLLCTNQKRHAILRDIDMLNGTTIHSLSSRRSAAIIVGDSGQPVFIPINNELVLLGAHWWANNFRTLHSLVPEINSIMSSLGGGYQLTTINLSGFPNYV